MDLSSARLGTTLTHQTLSSNFVSLWPFPNDSCLKWTFSPLPRFYPLERQLVLLPSKVYSSRCSFGGHSFTGSSPVCLIRGPECKLTAPVEELGDFPSHLSWSSGPRYPPSTPPSPPSYASLIPTLGLCQQFLSLD